MSKTCRRTFSMVIAVIAALSFLVSCGNRQEQIPEGTDISEVEVEFSHEAGFWENGLSLSLTAPKGYEIRYTTDGSKPDASSQLYKRPIQIIGNGNNWLTEPICEDIRIDADYFRLSPTDSIQDAWIIRAAVFAPDGSSGPVTTKTYFTGEDIRDLCGEKVLVISIVTDPDNLLDYETGIMIKGKWYDEWAETDDGKAILGSNNYWDIQGNWSGRGKEWEREVSLELFDGEDTVTVSQNCGIRIHGNASRSNPHKSIRLCFRKDYGKKYLEYDLFGTGLQNGTDGMPVYKSLVLRNGGNAATRILFKDGWQQSLLADLGFSVQQTRPAILYLNGEYWGVYALNDRYDDQYISDHFGVEDALVIKENELQEGNEEDMVLYYELLSFAEKDMTDPELWKQFTDIMDVESMAAYYAAQIYMANTDFRPDKNIELWRSVEIDDSNEYADGRWRYMLYDTEYSSGLYGAKQTSYERDTFADVLDLDGLFRSVLRNEEFKALFLSKLKMMDNQYMSYERVSSTLNSWVDEWKPMMRLQYMRFGGNAELLDDEVSHILQFYSCRSEYIDIIEERILQEDFLQAAD